MSAGDLIYGGCSFFACNTAAVTDRRYSSVSSRFPDRHGAFANPAVHCRFSAPGIRDFGKLLR
jgi:hypothetical protein